ncbi:MAG: NAD(P)/FAD-dependent oxidoreductase [Deltaproteobacteria bacterium]|nr:NAD(P)/FAD-dependent oxidoreductase [Deltaproteobacteria bacterium]
MSSRKTITIIGAGPSGLCAAINLAKAGYGVTVYERNPDVGVRFHGDFQGIENWSSTTDFMTQLEEMSIRPDFLCHPYSTGRFYRKGNHGGVVKADRPLFYLTLRGKEENSLDCSLRRQAEEAGIEIHFNRPGRSSEGEIVATGPTRPNVLASGVTFRTDSPDAVMAILNDEIAPGGYAYLLVRKERGTLASVYYRDFRKGADFLDGSIRYFQKQFPFAMEEARHFTGYGSFTPAVTAVHRGRLYVGEAAGFQDFLFGFGIRYALTSGYLAARSIIEEIDYDTLWQETLGKRLATSLSNRYLYQTFGSLAHRLIIRQTTRGNPWRFMHRFYNSSLSRKLAARPAARWFAGTKGGKTLSYKEKSG